MSSTTLVHQGRKLDTKRKPARRGDSAGTTMDPSEAEATFRKMLELAGFCSDRPDPAIAWEIFKSFVRLRVKCAHDGVLFQCGVYDWSGTDLFTLDFFRQFTIDLDDGYDHIEQLHCTFTCPPNVESRDLKTSLWLENYGNNHDAFFVSVESLTEFRHGMAHSGWTCRLQQHEV